MTEASLPAGWLPSRAERVTLFEDRAEVERRATVTAAAGKAWRAFGGVSPFVDDRSVQVASEGPARVLAVRVVRRLEPVTSAAPDEAASLDRELEALGDARQAAALRADRATAELGRLAAQEREWLGALARAPRGIAEGADGWRAGAVALALAREGAVAARVAAEREGAELGRRVARLQARRDEARGAKPRRVAALEVQLDGEGAGEVALTLTCRVPCALWRPEHHARLTRSGEEAATGALELVTYATCWQRTGERWEDVALLLSTARPGRVAHAPPLQEDVLRTRPKTSVERRQVVVEARDQEVAQAGLGRGARAVDEMPGVDDGGEPLQLAAAQRVTLASDGQPFRVEVGRRALSAALERVLLSEVAPVAHLRATASLPAGEGAHPLLAGPVRLALAREGGGEHVVGRAQVRYVAPGEPFELGFGSDDAVRVQREVEEESSRTAVIGTQHVERTVTLFLSNLSADAKALAVRERIPVSELEDLSVALGAHDGWTFQAKDGFLERAVRLAPRETTTLRYGYKLEASSRVVLPTAPAK